MLKSQLQVVGIALVSIFLLSLLPKYVVTGNKALESTSEIGEDDHSEEEMHSSTEFTAEKQQLIDSLRKQLTSNPSFSLASQLANSFKEVNRFDSAAYYFAEVARKNGDQKAVLAAGDTYYEAFTFAVSKERAAKLGELARDYLQQYLDANPDYLDAKTKIGMTYVSTENPMQGILMIRQVLEKDPENRLALFNMGVLSMQSGQWEKAIVRFQKLNELDPVDAQNKFYLGICLKELGRKEAAVQQFEEVLETETDPQIISTVNSYLEELK